MSDVALHLVTPESQAVPGALAPEERRRISTRLGAGLVGIGLLALGTLLVRLVPDEWQIGELLRGLAAAVVGIPTLVSGVRGVVTGDTRRATDQLVAIAVLAAAASGAFATATLIPLFLELGRVFEERSSLGARAAIDGIRALAARQAVKWHNGVEERVDPNSLVPGDEILVRPGERIAVDGTVMEGRAAVDQSAITGESLHEDVGPGSPVFAGTVALDGLLKIRVRGAGADTVLGRVVQLLADVERTSVPLLRLFERRAGVWLPLVLTVSATTLFFTDELSRAIAVLVVATPTALVVAGPAAVVAAMTVATRLRILIKSADFLERASDVDTLILDKTGTVTVGAPAVTHIQPANGESEERLLAVAAACGFGSLHPVSRAVVAEALARGIASTPPKDLQEKPGLGVVATVDGHPAILGRRALLVELGVHVGSESDEDISQVWVGFDGRCLGRFMLRDKPRAEARAALDAMRDLGIRRLVLLTGDRAAAAREVGEALGMDEVVAEVLPAQKLDVVRAEQAAGRVVMMVGDGVNDAPALGGADVGVAIGAELNEVALGGADVALLGTDLGRLPKLIVLADTTRRIIGQNVWLAFGLSVVLIALAARGVLDPLTGALAQSLAVFAVVANSARILRFGNRDAPGRPAAGSIASN
ncbi:MAG TPA: cation-translocating P-type ATPase [Candidatus Acidoferrales bacterium]|jgi:heavy metal translocating P-type ATPase|nr:cation-translocating P-type ATPase [Candidatus Acidoferrales bacterium]